MASNQHLMVSQGEKTQIDKAAKQLKIGMSELARRAYEWYLDQDQ